MALLCLNYAVRSDDQNIWEYHGIWIWYKILDESKGGK